MTRKGQSTFNFGYHQHALYEQVLIPCPRKVGFASMQCFRNHGHHTNASHPNPTKDSNLILNWIKMGPPIWFTIFNTTHIDLTLMPIVSNIASPQLDVDLIKSIEQYIMLLPTHSLKKSLCTFKLEYTCSTLTCCSGTWKIYM